MGSAVAERSAPSGDNTSDSAAVAVDLGGALEVVTPARLAGWAVDRRALDQFVEVEIRSGAEVIGRVTADRPRADLARAGLGDGRHGFEWRPAEPLPPDRLAEIESFARLGPDGGLPVQLPKRRLDGSFPPGVNTAPPSWIGELAALCRSIERHAQRLDTVGAGAPGGHRAAANEDMVRVRELLAAMHIRLEAVDGLQLRLDALASGVGRLADAKLSERRTHRALTWAVALTAAAAMISLSLGLVSYFR